MLYTVMGQRRQVVAIDADTGETRWTFREPDTMRYLRSPRTDFGKGVAYAEVDGRGVIYISTPASSSGRWTRRPGGRSRTGAAPVPLQGLPEIGVVDMIPDLVSDWEPWLDAGRAGSTTRTTAFRDRSAMITCSSPPIVVNGVVVVLAGHEPSYDQTRIENVPADIQGYDAKTGKRLWKFHVMPRPGELGHDTWENDAWKYSGNMCVVGAGVRRPAARARLHRHQRVDLSVLHGPSSRAQPVRRQRPRARREDRPAEVALPDPSQRAVELRHPDRADPDGSDRERHAGSRR